MKIRSLSRIAAALLAAGVAFAVSTGASAADTMTESPQVRTQALQSLDVSGIDHVGINVPDVNAASQFFAELLGAHVVSDFRPGKIPDAWKERFNWRKSSEIQRIVMMQLADGSKIELFQYSGPDISTQRPHEDDAAETHIALKTHDVDRSIAVLKKRGLPILNDPITNPDGEQWFYFLTPWGSQIELVFH